MRDILIPDKCPSCGSTLFWTDTQVDLICLNSECPAQILNKIENFLRVLGVEELSSTTLEKFNLSKIEDVYELNKEYILSLQGFQEKKTNTILEQIRNSLINVEPSKLIAAFGISGLGIKNAQKLVKYLNQKLDKTGYDILNDFFTIDPDELILIDGFGKKTIEILKKNIGKYKELYEKLLGYGLSFSTNNNGKLNGLIIAMTGSSPDGRKRNEIERLIEQNGGENSGVSKKTDILIAENINGTSSKLKNAKKFGIKIISYEEFFDMLES